MLGKTTRRRKTVGGAEIDPIPLDPRQKRILEMGGHRVILNCCRQWGKSTLTALKAVRHANAAPESLTLVVSPSARQSGEFIRKAAGFAGLRSSEMTLQFPNGSRIVGLPGSEATVRGFSQVGLLLVDEAARVPDELYRAVRPMLAVGNGDLWLMSTPFGKRGFFWDEWKNGGPEWERVEAPATECPRISKEFLDGERRSMGERWFRQEYMCEFGDAEDSVFRDEDIAAALDWSIRPLFQGRDGVR